MTGGVASGSDRAFDRGERAGLRAQLERLGIAVLPQDGSGLGPDCAALVVSTAVEEHVPDVAAARAQRHSHHPSLGAAGAFRGAASLDRGHRHERQVDGHGDGVRDPQGRRPRPLRHHRRRSAGARGARPARQRLCRAIGPARGRGRRERRLARALRARHRRDPQSPARPQGDDRGRGDVRHVAGAGARGAGGGRCRQSRSVRRRRACASA